MTTIAKPACVYCGAPADTQDHLIPKAMVTMLRLNLGTHNLAPACRPCNAFKGAMMPWDMRRTAQYLVDTAERLDAMADIAAALIAERRLPGAEVGQ